MKVTEENSRIRIRIRIHSGRGMDPRIRIRIRTKIALILNTALKHAMMRYLCCRTGPSPRKLMAVGSGSSPWRISCCPVESVSPACQWVSFSLFSLFSFILCSVIFVTHRKLFELRAVFFLLTIFTESVQDFNSVYSVNWIRIGFNMDPDPGFC